MLLKLLTEKEKAIEQTAKTLVVYTQLKIRTHHRNTNEENHYNIGHETVGAGDQVIDDNVPNSSIEWYTCKGQHVLTGLLIREVSDERDARKGPRRNLKTSYWRKGL